MTGTLTNPSHTRRPPFRGADDWEERRESDTPSAWVVVASVLPVLIAALALRPLVQGIAWWWIAVVATAATTGLMVAARRSGRGLRFVVLVVALVAVSCATSLASGMQPFTWLDRTGALGRAIEAINLNPAPLLETTDVRLIVALSIVWVSGAALFVAAIAGTPALAAAPALVLLAVPAFVIGSNPSPIIMVTVGIAFLALLWLSARPTRNAVPAAIVGALALTVAVVLPTVIPLNSPFLSGVTGAVPSPVQPGRPGTLIRLGQDLREPSPLEVFEYHTTSGSPEYLKLANLDDFSNGEWSPSVQDASQAPTANSDQVPVGVNPAFGTTGDAVIRITGLSSQYLPVPAGASSILSRSTSLDLQNWRWLAGSNTIRSTGPVTRPGDVYAVSGSSVFAGPYLDSLDARGALANPTSRVFAQPSAAQLRQDLALPSNLPAIIRNTAYSIGVGAADQYTRARALQSFFLSGQFTYSTTTPVSQGYDGDNMQVIAKFLQVRAGYCVHFASAMAVMARVMGIPSRIAVGYRPAASDAPGQFTVTNQQLHAWPELYIAKVGWVGFEPTPAASSSSNAQAAPSAAPASPAAPTALPLQHTAVTPQAGPTSTPSATGTRRSSAAPSSAPSLPLGGIAWTLAIIAALLAPAGARALQRQSRLARLRNARAPARIAWREVVDDAVDHGFHPALRSLDDPLSSVPTARAVLGRLPADLPPATRAAMLRILEALERERYAQTPDVEAHPALVLAVLEARQTLDDTESPMQVLRSRLLPASLVRWVRSGSGVHA
ncbi:transglutaminase family protein [Curtobacterium ammoniigenes]|uniref:transglutaminase family protein n=1 Tax=Curtobacterium ammoniigenes TaxID=395387 RepID=UPI0008326241|nr:DUF3488 and transglutaminase-like domain-containing protein [Curtobacterium ammoniigenes]